MNRKYNFSLDGIRAICILLTIAAHTPGAPFFINGTVGVDVFFALSGWLITCLLLDEKNRTETISLKSFYVRRAFRIVPLYVITIGLYGCAAFVMLRLKRDTTDIENFQASLPWLLTFNSEYRSAAAGNLFGHAWTLGVEEKFYIIWPLLLLMIARGYKWAAVLSFPIATTLIATGGETGLLLRGYLGLGFGTLLAVAAQTESVSTLLASGKSAFISMAATCGFYIMSKILPHEFIWNILISLSSAVLVGHLWNNEGGIAARIFAFKPLALAGKLTYAIYLVHVLVINVVMIIAQKLGVETSFLAIYGLTYVGCLAVGSILHIVVENPLIRLGRRFNRAAGFLSGSVQVLNSE